MAGLVTPEAQPGPVGTFPGGVPQLVAVLTGGWSLGGSSPGGGLVGSHPIGGEG